MRTGPGGKGTAKQDIKKWDQATNKPSGINRMKNLAKKNNPYEVMIKIKDLIKGTKVSIL